MRLVAEAAATSKTAVETATEGAGARMRHAAWVRRSTAMIGVAALRRRTVMHAATVIGRKTIVIARSPGPIIMSKVMIVVAVEDRGAIYKSRRIEAPAERAVEDSVAGNEGVRAKPGIPIPAGTEPTRSANDVSASSVSVCFR